jgi:hypothetical protein
LANRQAVDADAGCIASVMRTAVRINRGPLRGRTGWIAGSLEDRRARGITKAIVHAGADVELLETANLIPDRQLVLFADPENKNAAGGEPAASLIS